MWTLCVNLNAEMGEFLYFMMKDLLYKGLGGGIQLMYGIGTVRNHNKYVLRRKDLIRDPSVI